METSYRKIVSAETGSVCLHVNLCRGVTGGCRFALADLSALAREIEDAVVCSGLAGAAAAHHPAAAGHGARLTAAVAACPNACSMPQIRDIGFIAEARPLTDAAEKCVRCGRCEAVCREGALHLSAECVRIESAKCVGCGLCARACGCGVIDAGSVKLRLLLGGRMGRHPRFAAEMCKADPETAGGTLLSLLGKLVSVGKPASRVAEILDCAAIDEHGGDHAEMAT